MSTNGVCCSKIRRESGLDLRHPELSRSRSLPPEFRWHGKGARTFVQGELTTREFAGDNGRFWQMHDLLFETQQSLEDESLLQFADQLGLSPDKLSQALRHGTHTDRVAMDFRGGVRSA
jgi:hypothetical protein